jgi:TolB-like protein/Tfp pilus assembly protein PilF
MTQPPSRPLAPSRQSEPESPRSRRSRTDAFLAELKRRHVFRIAALYAAGAFVVLQAADLLLRGLEVPDWAFSLLVVLTIVGLPLALVLAWTYDLTPHGVIRTPPAPADDATEQSENPAPAPALPAVTAPRRSVAVLPFANLSELKENEYFSDGMTEELIASLARIHGLKVVSRTSVMQYKQTTQSVPIIARELGVATILEGTVRRYGDRVRVTAQLIDAAADDHLWVETYDRTLDDAWGIQSELARKITEALEVQLSSRESRLLEEPPTADPEAYDLYLRGRYLWNKRTEHGQRQSVPFLERALAADPKFALAAAGLADAYLTLGMYGLEPPGEVMERARAAAQRTLSLDASRTEALAARACVRALYDWDWTGAEEDFRRAIGMNPRYAVAQQWYALNLLTPQGRFDDAERALARAAELEPLSRSLQTSQAILLSFERRPEEAIETYARLLEAHPDFGMGHSFLSQTLAACGRYDEAVAASREAVRHTVGGAEAVAILAYTLAYAGQTGEARTLLEGLLQRSEREYVSPVLFAYIHIGLQETGPAIDALRRALDLRAADLAWLKVRPIFDPLREQPGYAAILRDLKLA